jgi:hypothetical protein
VPSRFIRPSHAQANPTLDAPMIDDQNNQMPR